MDIQYKINKYKFKSQKYNKNIYEQKLNFYSSIMQGGTNKYLLHELGNDIRAPICWSIAYSPNGNMFAAGYADGTVIMWDCQLDYQMIYEKKVDKFNLPIYSIAFSPNEKQLSCSSGNDLIVSDNFDSSRGIKFKSLISHSSVIISVIYSPDGRHIASAGGDGTVKIWDSQNKKRLHTLFGHDGFVTSIAYSPDGSYIASGSFDGTIKIWNSYTAADYLKNLSDHTDRIWKIVYSPNGQQIA
jgi:WD40 repeat protein